MKASYHPADEQLLDALRAGQKDRLSDFYRAHRAEFIRWAAKAFKTDEEVAVDAYQDSMIIFYENAVRGRLQHLTCTLKTYLFAVGKHLLLRRLQQQTRVQFTDEDALREWAADDAMARLDEEKDRNHQQEVVHDQVMEMEEPCRSLLTLFYFDRLSMTEIARRMNYKNADVAKSQKARCLKGLRTRVLKYLPS